MDIKTHISSIAEAKVIYELTRLEYHIFNQVTGKAPFDLVAYKNNILYKISVKSVSVCNKYGSYDVQLKRVRSNKNINKIYNFDSTECDILAIYIYQEDLVLFYKASDIKVKSTLTINKEYIKESRKVGVLMGLENLDVE